MNKNAPIYFTMTSIKSLFLGEQEEREALILTPGGDQDGHQNGQGNVNIQITVK